jgi:uncharacterized protein YndB with AHSA1/START domain
VAVVELPTPAETTFVALTDTTVYSQWLQVPVTIDGDRFAATLEWGTEVRGRYELVVHLQLIVMSWDFARSPHEPASPRSCACGVVVLARSSSSSLLTQADAAGLLTEVPHPSRSGG